MDGIALPSAAAPPSAVCGRGCSIGPSGTGFRQHPQLDGVAGAWHTSGLAFCFDNTKRCEQGTGNTPQALAKTMATARANFAATGNPGLRWLPADPTRMQTMIFDNQVRMVDDPQGNVRRIIGQ